MSMSLEHHKKKNTCRRTGQCQRCTRASKLAVDSRVLCATLNIIEVVRESLEDERRPPQTGPRLRVIWVEFSRGIQL